MINNSDAFIEAYSLEDLAEEAEFVVVGKIIEVSPLVPGYLLFFSDGFDRFLFDVTLLVEDDLDGRYAKDTVTFRIHDSREDFGIGVEDEQHFEVGERVLVFIGEKEPDSVMGDAYLVQGVTQGKFLLQDGIAYGTTYGDDFSQGITEEELILKIKDMRLDLIPEQDQPVSDKCRPGTSLQNGICVEKSKTKDAEKRNDSYYTDEALRLAPEKPDVEETRTGGSGTGMLDESSFDLTLLVVVIVVGAGSGIGLTIFWQRK